MKNFIWTLLRGYSTPLFFISFVGYIWTTVVGGTPQKMTDPKLSLVYHVLQCNDKKIDFHDYIYGIIYIFVLCQFGIMLHAYPS